MADVLSDAAFSKGDLMRRLADLERLVAARSTSRRLEAATIGTGGVTVKGGQVLIEDEGSLRVDHANGAPLLKAGPGVDSTGGQVEEVLIVRPDGTALLWAYGRAGDGYGYLAMYDHSGDIIFSDDADSGQGLATPYLVGGAFASMSVPTDSTTSGSFVALQKAIWVKQHPKIKLWALTDCTATTAEIRWRIASGPDAGTILGGAAVSFGAGFGYAGHGPYDLPGAHLSEIEIDVECRVASGAGQVSVRMLAAIGVQS